MILQSFYREEVRATMTPREDQMGEAENAPYFRQSARSLRSLLRRPRLIDPCASAAETASFASWNTSSESTCAASVQIVYLP